MEFALADEADVVPVSMSFSHQLNSCRLAVLWSNNIVSIESDIF